MGELVGVPKFRESEMNTCQCCHPMRSRTIVTLDPNGRAQYTCPKTRITMRYHDGAQTYLGGHLNFLSDVSSNGVRGAGTLVDSAGHPLVAAVIK